MGMEKELGRKRNRISLSFNELEMEQVERIYKRADNKKHELTGNTESLTGFCKRLLQERLMDERLRPEKVNWNKEGEDF